MSLLPVEDSFLMKDFENICANFSDSKDVALWAFSLDVKDLFSLPQKSLIEVVRDHIDVLSKQSF